MLSSLSTSLIPIGLFIYTIGYPRILLVNTVGYAYFLRYIADP